MPSAKPAPDASRSRLHLGAARRHFGNSIKGTTEFNCVSLWIGMTSGPKFVETVQQMGLAFLGLGAAIVLVAVIVNLLAGHFLLRLRFDELLGATCGVAANPVQMVFASKLTGSDRTDVAYSMTFPTGTS